METDSSHGRTDGSAAPPAPGASLPDAKPEADTATRLLLTVWAGPACRWHAQAELPGDATRAFDSPFELARFLAQLADRRSPPAEGGGLR